MDFLIQFFTETNLTELSRFIERKGRFSLRAVSRVKRVPLPISSLNKINVPSLNFTFSIVRCAYSLVEVSVKGYILGIIPSSASRPFGHIPPQLILFLMAKSRAARSTPVCPPEIILFNLICFVFAVIIYYKVSLRFYKVDCI